MEEHAGKLWFGICAGRTVPSARLALAGTRITALDKTNTVMASETSRNTAHCPTRSRSRCSTKRFVLRPPGEGSGMKGKTDIIQRKKEG